MSWKSASCGCSPSRLKIASQSSSMRVDNGPTSNGRAGTCRYSNERDRDARPVRCNVWLYRLAGPPVEMRDGAHHVENHAVMFQLELPWRLHEARPQFGARHVECGEFQFRRHEHLCPVMRPRPERTLGEVFPEPGRPGD